MERAPLSNTSRCGSLNVPAVTVCCAPSLLSQLTIVPMLISRSSNLKSSIFEEIITLLGAFASGVDDGVGGGVGVAGADVAVGTGLDVACSVVGTGCAVAVGSAVAVGCTVAVSVLIAGATGAMVGRDAEVGSEAAEGAALGGTGVTVADTVAGATADCC